MILSVALCIVVVVLLLTIKSALTPHCYLLQDVDVVPTDVVAALILIRRQQHMRPSRVDIEGRNSINAVAIQKPPWMTVPLAAHYMTFASACYGWPYYVYDNICCGPCRLLTGCR